MEQHCRHPAMLFLGIVGIYGEHYGRKCYEYKSICVPGRGDVAAQKLLQGCLTSATRAEITCKPTQWALRQPFPLQRHQGVEYAYSRPYCEEYGNEMTAALTPRHEKRLRTI